MFVLPTHSKTSKYITQISFVEIFSTLICLKVHAMLRGEFVVKPLKRLILVIFRGII